jgi:hypothetical protein
MDTHTAVHELLKVFLIEALPVVIVISCKEQISSFIILLFQSEEDSAT